VKIVSQPECQDWLETSLGKGFTTVESHYAHYLTYALPIKTGVKTALAREVSHSIDPTQGGLFWITLWGILPSLQNMALFDGYRKSLGENRAIQAAPGHVFGEPDLEQLECLFDLTLYFNWDASLIEGAGTVAVKTSHDGFISIHANNEVRLRQFQDILEGLMLERVNSAWGNA
jgi:hypothetical protein